MNKILSLLLYLIARSFSATYRYKHIGHEHVADMKHILAIWHQNLFHGIQAQNGKKYVVIISRSRDADPVALLCRRLGHVVCRGSSRSKEGKYKGGKEAKDQMIAQIKAGLPGAITVDGPKGPAKVVKPGIVDMAMNSGVPIVPYSPIPDKYWSFKSWDKFRLPKPFSKIFVHYGKPISVPQGSNYDEICAQVRDSLLALENSI